MMLEFSKITGIRGRVLRGKSRVQHIAEARQMFYLLLREKTDLTYQEIARKCNRDSHSTVVYGVRKMRTLLEMGDPQAVDMWDEIKNIKTYEEQRRIKSYRANRNI